MQLSTRGRYGLRFILDLAVHSQGGPVPLKDVASREDISEKYLWQMASRLKSAGLVNSTAGPKGGYTLACNPDEVTLRDILAALEGNAAFVPCVDSPEECQRSAGCVARTIWTELTQTLQQAMDDITLRDMIDRYDELNKPVLDYTI